MPTLREVVALLDTLYPPEWADDWDAVGTVVGDPKAEISKILLAQVLAKPSNLLSHDRSQRTSSSEKPATGL